MACVLCPKGMVSPVTCTAESLARRVIAAPVTGAGSPSVTVPFTGFPPNTVLASSVSCSGGSRVSVADTVAPLSVAVSVAVCKLATATVKIGKSTELLPKGTCTDRPGSFTFGLSVAIATLTMPAWAVPDSVTVPVRLRPPRIDAGVKDSVDSWTVLAGTISSVAVSVTPLPVAAMVASVVLVTAEGLIVVWAEALPAGTTSCTTTGAAALLVCSPTA